jgi:GNAT superfamily N-acetyltransferase
MRLRKAALDDAEPLAVLIKEIGWFELLNRETLGDATRRVRDRLEACLADGSHAVFVAESDEKKIVGYVSVHWLPYLFMGGPEGYVSELFIAKDARGKGIGRQLLEAVKEQARQRGCSRLSLINLRRRESYQRRFYLKAGWQEREDAANFICPIT